MKNIIFLLIILQLISCVSSKKVAESRNSEFADHNSFEFFKIWRDIDILRFDDNILNVKIALIPEDQSIDVYKADSQLVAIYDSLQILISEKMNRFQALKKTYFDTTDQRRLKIYQNLKSDSTDHEFLSRITHSPYYELYEDILKQLRKSIQKSTFYSSQSNFEEYIKNRSIEVVDMTLIEDIFGKDVLSVKNLSKNRIATLKENQIDFIIAFSGSYNVSYSDRSRDRIGSESIHLILFDVRSANRVSAANITHFWGSE